jgi:hypothetical protein
MTEAAQITPSTLLINPDGTASVEFFRYLQEIANPPEPPPGVPVGMVLFSPTGVVPDDYLACEGAAFSGTEYPDLADYLGGTTLPDYTDRVLRGAGPLAGAAGSLQEDAMQRLTGSLATVRTPASAAGDGVFSDTTAAANEAYAGAGSGGAKTVMFDSGDSTAAGGARVSDDETRVKAAIGKFIIKATA